VESKIDQKQYVIKKIMTSSLTEKEKLLVKQEADLLMNLKRFKHPNLM